MAEARLAGRVALVTGASGGLGRAIALELARQGAAVGVHYGRRREAAEAVVQAIGERGGRAVALGGDLTDPATPGRLVEAVQAWGDGLHILVNNAGIARDTLILRMKDEDWDAVLETNLGAAFRCIRAVLRPMVRQRSGRIINVVSIAGQIGNAGQANYAAAKAGLIGLTKATAREVASRGITVNAVAPGLIDVGLTEALGPEQVRRFLDQIPLGRLGTAAEVAAAVAFLASDDAAYITGHVLNVDGGLVMR
ncbi:MAG: 3-oxoacyl-[acyl-carrier-protein] reductase [Armatimonadota bacterium]|nr:3-oxoacyl-[acyl-carrier-protein] reductase [Armatimonadota bacterium]MDR7447610.1 3-oxoacyl-[acyl-carrier-protein] reductase [Armatimonadota bacterium]MDR7459509.1 3-oxoacyl-[acyl-carrier-protein] reductase [Armatimonadota bacterium]MDR7480487.1 3-oxoacyl-[acyl-carrier-protein] reductase [Armatimonadota bacterium]MDR7489081.1 3-oxoacyl-[acyl-carrier-protein] reductase [Armatimonadota bacterium]